MLVGKTILLAGAGAHQALSQPLQALGCRLAACSPTLDALLIAVQQQPVDLLVVEIGAQGQPDGAQAARMFLRARDLPVIFYASGANCDELEKVRAIPSYGVMVDSVSARQLQATLEAALALFNVHHAERLDAQRCQLALEGTRAGAWEWNLVNNQVSYSSEIYTMLGIPAGGARDGQMDLLKSLVHPEDLPGCHAAMGSYLNGSAGHYEHEYRLRARDGSYLWVADRARITLRAAGGRPIRVSGVLIDITANKQAELRRREELSRLEFAVQATRTGVWDWHIADNQNYFSPMLLELLGFAPGQAPGPHNPWRQHVHPEDLPGLSAAQAYHLSGATPSMEHEFRTVQPDGSVCWLLTRGQVIERAPDGSPRRMLGTTLDITARKQAEMA